MPNGDTYSFAQRFRDIVLESGAQSPQGASSLEKDVAGIATGAGGLALGAKMGQETAAADFKIDEAAVRNFAANGGLPAESPSLQQHGADMGGVTSAGAANAALSRSVVERV